MYERALYQGSYEMPVPLSEMEGEEGNVGVYFMGMTKKGDT